MIRGVKKQLIDNYSVTINSLIMVTKLYIIIWLGSLFLKKIYYDEACPENFLQTPRWTTVVKWAIY